MAIVAIDHQKCDACGICILSCPADVIRMDKEIKKAVIVYRQDCVVCCWCIAECPQDAILLTPIRTSPLFLSWG